ncbi:hypothetical protein Vretimale_6677 [Volvox reticuliferus]|uniref:Uncharacterized protein n=1 Tax=Volvox reticuliferus TaxID=1737510 RepID=A0A8J4G851_9CHLO|nr:hypothetical protein Vretimale_6677 [Volvox reticuliferus]
MQPPSQTEREPVLQAPAGNNVQAALVEAVKALAANAAKGVSNEKERKQQREKKAKEERAAKKNAAAGDAKDAKAAKSASAGARGGVAKPSKSNGRKCSQAVQQEMESMRPTRVSKRIATKAKMQREEPDPDEPAGTEAGSLDVNEDNPETSGDDGATSVSD